jgi:hypothetical protein
MRLLLGLSFSLLFVITSCNKKQNDSYTCNCTYGNEGYTNSDSYLIGEKPSTEAAQTDCNAHKDELMSSGATQADCIVVVTD